MKVVAWWGGRRVKREKEVGKSAQKVETDRKKKENGVQ